MIMCQNNIFKSRASLINEVFINDIIICGINKIWLFFRLDIVTKDSKHTDFKLSNIDSFFCVLRDDLRIRTHVEENYKRKVYMKISTIL